MGFRFQERRYSTVFVIPPSRSKDKGIQCEADDVGGRLEHTRRQVLGNTTHSSQAHFNPSGEQETVDNTMEWEK